MSRPPYPVHELMDALFFALVVTALALLTWGWTVTP